MRRTVALLLLAAALAAPASSSALSYGMGDETPQMFSASLFTDLPIQRVRYVAAYDTALRGGFERQQADAFLRAARAGGYDTLVSFEHSRERGQAGRLPSTAAYVRGVRAFMARYPWIRTYSPWDEANSCSQPTCHSPAAAARYYLAMRRACPQCTVPALEVLDGQDVSATIAYVRSFQRALGRVRPTLWALHNYTDVNRFRSTGTQAYLRAVRGTVWLTETGGLYAFGAGFPASSSRQVRAEQQMFRLARSSSRIARLYIYSWTGGGSFDAGLMSPSGTPRPAYRTVASELGG